MKKLFKLGFLSLLLSSLVVTSGCYKKDIDDLEDRVTELEKWKSTHEDVYKTLKGDVDALKTAVSLLEGKVDKMGKFVADVTADGTMALKITYADGKTSTVAITAPTATPSTIVKAYADKSAYYELEVYKTTKPEDGTYIIRIGKDFSNAVNYGSDFEEFTAVVNAEVGKSSYVLVNVNPSGFALEQNENKEWNFTFDYVARTREDATGLLEAIKIKGAKRAIDYTKEEWEAIFGAKNYTQLENRWAIEFEFDKRMETLLKKNPSYKLYVAFPKDGASYNGIWESAKAPVVKDTKVEMQYTLSTNYVTFTDKVINAVAGTLVIDPDKNSTDVHTDGSYKGTVYTNLAKFDADPFIYLVNPKMVIDDVKQYRNAVEITIDAADKTKLLAVINAALAKSTAADKKDADDKLTHKAYQDFTLTFDQEVDNWPSFTAVRPEDRLVYTMHATAQDLQGTTTSSNTFTLTARRVLRTYDLADMGMRYIPVNPTDLTTTHNNSTAPGDLRVAFYAMGYTNHAADEATFVNVTTETWNEKDSKWVASTEPVTAVYNSSTYELKVSFANTIAIGKHRISYNFKVNTDGVIKDVKIRETIEIIPPTVYVKLKNAELDNRIVVNNVKLFGANSTLVTAVVVSTHKNEEFDLAQVFNIENGAILTGKTWKNGAFVAGVPSGYVYDAASVTIGNNSGGLVGTAIKPTATKANHVAITKCTAADEPQASEVKLTVTLKTGQVVPVVVVKSNNTTVGETAQFQYDDWYDGKFFIAVVADHITTLVGKNAGPFEIGDVLTTPVYVTGSLVRARFDHANLSISLPVADRLPVKVGQDNSNVLLDVQVQIPGSEPAVYVTRPMTGYEAIYNDPRVKGGITFEPGKIIPSRHSQEPTIPVGVTSLYTIEQVMEDLVVIHTPIAIGDPDRFTIQVPVVKLKGVQNYLQYFKKGDKIDQELKITVKDIFGVERTITQYVTFGHQLL